MPAGRVILGERCFHKLEHTTNALRLLDRSVHSHVDASLNTISERWTHFHLRSWFVVLATVSSVDAEHKVVNKIDPSESTTPYPWIASSGVVGGSF
jgi:hypothetical protein